MRDVFPEPYVVPGHVADAPYRVGLAFKRRTIAIWVTSCLLSAYFVWRPVVADVPASLCLVLACLVALTVIRRVFLKTRRLEIVLSVFGTLVLLEGVGSLIGHLREDGLNLTMLYLVPAGLAVYTLAAGKDFSHFGYAFLGSVMAVFGGLFAAALRWLDPLEAAVATVATIAATVYVASDLTMLMRRRLPTEAAGAAVDIYRDTLNFLTYTFRVVQYRRTYRFH